MDEVGIDFDIMSPIPVSITYWADPQLALEFARHINDWLAIAIEQSGGRIKGLGTVPLQDKDLAIAEMERALGLGISGLELGTVVGSSELSAIELRPFFKAASDQNVPIFIHPIDGDCAPRATTQMDRFGIGMHTDSALAASSLVFGGVLEECKDLRVCLSHGGGAFPWTFPRLKWQATRQNPDQGARFDHLVSRLYTDSLVFDPEHLAILKTRFGTDHIVYGTDYPFLPRDDPPGSIFDEAHLLGICTEVESAEMRGPNALRFMNLDPLAERGSPS
jgi:aminocarboxymuconate-semialdehyde decarboxylase